jgi:hypothetical protein
VVLQEHEEKQHRIEGDQNLYGGGLPLHQTRRSL